MLVLVASATVLVAGPALADGRGGCNVIINSSCTVSASGAGYEGSRSGGSGGGSPNDPCTPYPNAAYGAKPPAVSQACAEELQGRYCDTIKADALGGLEVGSFAVLSVAEVDALNKLFRADGCPPVVTPATLAEEAYKTIEFPHPSGSRSPSATLLYRGYSFSYVNLWTYFWTSPGTWKNLTAVASAAGFTATVMAKPTQLIFDPGDGSSAVSCAGPGRGWTSADGNAAPSSGACGYQYTRVSASPITSTQSIVWKITWTGTGNTSGQFPQLVTSTNGQLNVMQIQTVVTR